MCTMRRALADDEQDAAAKEIVEHLELCNWKIEPGKPLRGDDSYSAAQSTIVVLSRASNICWGEF